MGESGHRSFLTAWQGHHGWGWWLLARGGSLGLLFLIVWGLLVS